MEIFYTYYHLETMWGTISKWRKRRRRRHMFGAGLLPISGKPYLFGADQQNPLLVPHWLMWLLFSALPRASEWRKRGCQYDQVGRAGPVTLVQFSKHWFCVLLHLHRDWMKANAVKNKCWQMFYTIWLKEILIMNVDSGHFALCFHFSAWHL